MPNIVSQYNYKNGMYDKVHLPDNWKISCFESDMDTIVNCVSCGREMAFGEGYTSRIFQTAHGFGYCECAGCYGKHYFEEALYHGKKK